jgi:hypothetical protein
MQRNAGLEGQLGVLKRELELQQESHRRELEAKIESKTHDLNNHWEVQYKVSHIVPLSKYSKKKQSYGFVLRVLKITL